VIAQPEVLSSGDGSGPSQASNIHGGSNTEELVTMLNNLQTTIVNKIAMTNVQEYPDRIKLLELAIPLGFQPSRQLIHNLCLIFAKTIDQNTVILFDDPANKVLLDLTLLMVQLWISEYIEHDNFILSSVVELVEVLICS